MPDPVVENEPTPTGGSESSEPTTELWEELGFKSRKAFAEEFADLKTKVTTLKPEAREAADLKAKLATLQEAEDARQAAEMSELELEKKALVDSKAELAVLQAQYDKSLKDIIYERAVSKRLGDYADADRDLVRSLYDAAGNFADEDELNGLLDEIDKKWKAHMDAYGGGERPDVGGSSRGRAPVLGPASKDEVILAGDIVKGGAAALLKRRAGNR